MNADSPAEPNAVGTSVENASQSFAELLNAAAAQPSLANGQPADAKAAGHTATESTPADGDPASHQTSEASAAPVKNIAQEAAGKSVRDQHAAAVEPQVAAKAVLALEPPWSRVEVPTESNGAAARSTSAPAEPKPATPSAASEAAAAAQTGNAEKLATAQEIAVRIARPDSPTVDLHLTERGGEVHVAVRTSDAALQTSLRQDLPTLVRSLERAGFQTETFVPSPAPRFSSAAPVASGDLPGGDAFGSRDEQRRGSQQQRQKSRRPPVLEEIESMEQAA